VGMAHLRRAVAREPHPGYAGWASCLPAVKRVKMIGAKAYRDAVELSSV